MHDEQLSWDFTGDEIEGEFVHTGYDLDPEEVYDTYLMWPSDWKTVEIKDTCKHKVIFRSCKKGFVTYCNKCGKILSVRNRREK